MSGERNPGIAGRRPGSAPFEQSGPAVERMRGLRRALEQFVVEAPDHLVPLFGAAPDPGSIEDVQGTSLFEAIGDCAGLTAAIYASAEPQGRLLIALDEQIDDLIFEAAFGESPSRDMGDDASSETPKLRTAIETALVEEFARALGAALEAALARIAPLKLTFEQLVLLKDQFALGRRDSAAAAARISVPLGHGSGECLLLFPQLLLSPFRKALEQGDVDETPTPDPRWSRLMEIEVQQTQLPMNAILEEVSMTLGDVANFKAGSILPLQTEGFGAVRLDCSGRSVFLCRLGQGQGRYRLEIASGIGPAIDLATALAGC